MDQQAVIDGVLTWAREAVPDLQGGYDYEPSAKTQSLPDIVATLSTVEVVVDDPRFRLTNVQQALITAYGVNLSIMVDNGEPQAAAQSLRGWCDALAASLLADSTLGGRVPFASPLIIFDYTRPFVRYQDGTKGREVAVEMVVGELVEAPQ
jgi:hypothetical protein